MDFISTRMSFSRPIKDYAKVQAIYAAVIRNRKMFANIKTPGLVLDIGCGPNFRATNINLDYGWRPGIDICWDVTQELPIPDDYVAGVFTEHCLEHISFESALFVLSEMRRISQPGTYIRIVVPSLEIYVNSYVDIRDLGKGQIPYGESDEVDGINSPAMGLNRIMRAHGHQFIYDFATLEKMLQKVGFIEISKKIICRQLRSAPLVGHRAPRNRIIVC